MGNKCYTTMKQAVMVWCDECIYKNTATTTTNNDNNNNKNNINISTNNYNNTVITAALLYMSAVKAEQLAVVY